MRRSALFVLIISALVVPQGVPAVSYQPVLHGEVGLAWSRVMGPLSGNPVVDLSGDLVNGEVIRTRFTDIPRWIVSGDVDSDGNEEAVIMFDDGTLRTAVLERGSLRGKSSVEGLEPDSPPVVLTVDTEAAEKGLLGIDDRGDLISVKEGSGSARRISDGFSRVSYPVAADLDGDGMSEILAIDDEGHLTVVLGRTSRKKEDRTQILPDSRITIGDLDADGALEAVLLTRPSDESSPGRLGDDLEAQGVAVFSWNGRIIDLEDEFTLRPGEFFEDLTPVLADVREEGGDEVVLTVSQEGKGSMIVILSYAGGRLREVHRSPDDRKGRYMQVLGASVLGDSQRKLILAVSGPSASGDLEAFRTDLAATRLSFDGTISTHIEGTRILETALIGDFNGDGEREIIAPDEDRQSISMFMLRKNRFTDSEIFTGNRSLSSNICPGDFNGDGKVDVAAGFEDGTLIFILGK